MTVEMQFNQELTGVDAATAATTIEELEAIDGTASSTSGTYTVNFVRFQWPRTSTDDEGNEQVDQESRLHASVTLEDADDSDYPDVKNDLAAKMAGLSADFGDAEAIKAELSGSLS